MTENESNNAFSHALSESIINASPDGILVVNHLNEVVTVNLKFFEVWRIPCPDNDPQKALHSSDTPFLDQAVSRVQDPHGFLLRVRQLYATPELNDKCEIKLKDGRVLERHSCTLKDKNDNYLGRVWFFRDISEHTELENELRDLASIDPLTGTINRREFFKRADEELMRAKRYNTSLSVVMLDLDFFKAINDQWGHEQGDKVLQATTQIWQKTLRKQDILGRIGGEEFAVLLPNTDLQAASETATRLNMVLAEHRICPKRDGLHCTVSVGVAQLTEQDGSFDSCLRRADKALYNAKASGRNCIKTEMD